MYHKHHNTILLYAKKIQFCKFSMVNNFQLLGNYYYRANQTNNKKITINNNNTR